MTTNQRALRNAFGHFATGVTVVTYHEDGEVRGATVNSFTSVSLDPALVLVSLAKAARSAALLADRPFAINVLRQDQLDVALRFAGRPVDDLTIGWGEVAGVPVLAQSAATFVCTPWRQHDSGDYVLALGQV